MKNKHLLIFLSVFLFCTAERCNRGNSDLMTRLYQMAQTSREPLSQKKEQIYNPLLGGWLIGQEKYVIVKKKEDAKMEFTFLSDDLKESDIVYTGSITTINGNKYLNLLAYEGNYMYFKIDSHEQDNLDVRMITYHITNKLNGNTIYTYLQKNKIEDTCMFFYKVAFEKMNANLILYKQKSLFKNQVYKIEDYEKFATKYLYDSSLTELKNKALDNSIKSSYSINSLIEISNKYPEITKKAEDFAFKNCRSTIWCIDYLNQYKDIRLKKDSIINRAFSIAQSGDDFYMLLTNFPNHPNCKGIATKVAIAEFNSMNNSFSSVYEENKLKEKYAAHPEIINIYNTIKLFGNIKLDNNDFQINNYLLNKKGKVKLDQFCKLVSLINKNGNDLTDFYFTISDKNLYYANDELIYFKRSVNKGLSVKKYLEEKNYGNIHIHLIPYGKYRYIDDTTALLGKFYINDKILRKEKQAFYQLCYNTGQMLIIPDANSELINMDYIREEEYENYLISQLANQIVLYKAKKPYNKIIPLIYWDPSYEKSTSDFHLVRETFLKKSAELGIEQKHIQNFIIPEE